MTGELSLAVLAERLSAHQEKDTLQFNMFTTRMDKVDKTLVRMHKRFDSLLLGMLCTALATIGSLGLIVYNTLKFAG